MSNTTPETGLPSENATDGLPKLRLGDVLRNYGIVSEADIEAAVAYGKQHGLRIGEALVAMGITNQDQINWAVAQHLSIPYVEVTQMMLDTQLIERYPFEELVYYRMLPLVATDQEISIALADPTHLEGISALMAAEKRAIKIAIAPEHDILSLLHWVFRVPFTDQTALSPLTHIKEKMNLESLLSTWISQGLDEFFFDPDGKEYVIRGRSLGAMRELRRESRESFLPIIREMRARFSIPVEVETALVRSITLPVQSHTYSVKLAAMPVTDGVAFRLQVGSDIAENTLSDLDLSAEHQAEIRLLVQKAQGLILIASPQVHTRERLIRSLLSPRYERPFRGFLLASDLDIPGLFKIAPRLDQIDPLLAQSPDLIVYDLLDEFASHQLKEILRMACAHLVVSSIRFGSGEEVISLFLEQGIPATVLKGRLLAVISGITVPLLCDACKQPKLVALDALDELLPLPKQDDIASGCAACHHSGYQGTRLVVDFLPCSHTLIEMIKQGHLDQKTAIRAGYPSLKDRLIELAQEGRISVAEMLRHITL